MESKLESAGVVQAARYDRERTSAWSTWSSSMRGLTGRETEGGCQKRAGEQALGGAAVWGGRGRLFGMHGLTRGTDFLSSVRYAGRRLE
jgi:hypothetical protein